MGHTEQDRPKFDYTYDNTTGELAVQIPKDQNTKLDHVALHHAQTMQTKRRDFRWAFLSNNRTEPCKLPFIPPRKPLFGANCLAPIYWAK